MNSIINSVFDRLSQSALFRSDLDRHVMRAAMVFIFFVFGYQKWNKFTAEDVAPLVSHSPMVFWLIPTFGVRGAGFFLGTSELTFGTLILLGFWNPKLGVLGAIGSIFTFLGTVTIIPFFPGSWSAEAGGFPIMSLPGGFLMKDFLLLATSFYLLKQDLTRGALE